MKQSTENDDTYPHSGVPCGHPSHADNSMGYTAKMLPANQEYKSHLASRHVARRNRLWPVKPCHGRRIAQPPSPHAEAIATLKELIITDGGPTLHAIIMAVCIVKNINANEFHSIRRFRPGVEARQVYYFLARELTRHSLTEIGERCGGKDHSTVHHGIGKVAANLDQYADTIAAAKKLLGAE